MDPKTGCGLPSAGQKARLLIDSEILFVKDDRANFFYVENVD